MELLKVSVLTHITDKETQMWRQINSICTTCSPNIFNWLTWWQTPILPALGSLHADMSYGRKTHQTGSSVIWTSAHFPPNIPNQHTWSDIIPVSATNTHTDTWLTDKLIRCGVDSIKPVPNGHQAHSRSSPGHIYTYGFCFQQSLCWHTSHGHRVLQMWRLNSHRNVAHSEHHMCH
jgi:hypothetical protein